MSTEPGQPRGGVHSARRPSRLRRAAAALAALLLAGAALEGAFRLLAPRLGWEPVELEHFRHYVITGEHPWYQPHPYVGYVLRPEHPNANALGFSDDDHPLERTPGVPRIACLGASTTEGGNAAGRRGAYPTFLAAALEERLGRPVEVMNWGLSGWTSAEVQANYFLNIEAYRPDVVILHLGANDVEARLWPGYRRDYAHFRRPWHDLRFGFANRLLVRASRGYSALLLRRAKNFTIQNLVNRPLEDGPLLVDGGLAPGTTAGFRANLRRVLRAAAADGAHGVLATLPYAPHPGEYSGGELFAPGVDDHNEVMRELAAELGCTLVDLAEWFGRPETGGQGEFVDLVHVTPEGNRLKAERIAEALLEAGLLEP